MRKLFFLLALVGFTTVFAQDEQKTQLPTFSHKVVTNGFWSNWFVDAGADFNSFYCTQSLSGSHRSPFWKGRVKYGFDVSLGKWATPVFGMRLKFTGARGARVNSTEDEDLNHTYRMWTLSLQPMINLNNLFCGYKPRVWNISAYAGGGFLLNKGDICYSRTHSYSLYLTAGLFNTFNVTKRLHINLDLGVAAGERNMDGNSYCCSSQNKILKTHDCQFTISAGVGVNLGKVGWQNAVDVDALMADHEAQLEALNQSLEDAEAECARMKALLAAQPVSTNAVQSTDFSSTTASVFFNFNKTKIASRKDLVNVRELANLAKEKGAKLVVTGYADSNTGSAEVNQKLSEGRANAVVKELVKMGVSRDNIEVVAKGGVNDLDPYSYNRRATVTLK